jgi:hypothetical protein
MDFLREYMTGWCVNTRLHYPKNFNFSIGLTNVICFGITALLMLCFYEPLAYMYFLLIFTSTEADGNFTGDKKCNEIFKRLDVIVIFCIILILYLKTSIYYALILIPLAIVHNWKRYDKNSEEYEIKMNIWHIFAAFMSCLGITIASYLS